MLRVVRSSLRDQLVVGADAKVLDVGGGLNPHPRADVVIDIVGADSELVGSLSLNRGAGSREGRRWVVHDLCSSRPFPFARRQFDFVICTHVLEDVRDPIRVCEEMQRVGARGYIETPSMESELTWRLEGRHHTGRGHHRWLVEAAAEGLVFRHKPHFVNGFWQARIPRRWWKTDPKRDVIGILWEDSFSCEERVLQPAGFLDEVVAFVRARRAYPDYFYDAWRAARSARSILRGIRRRSH